jgi:hypothetical protein
LYDADGSEVGQWHANNVVDHSATLRFVPNWTYTIDDPIHPHTHDGAVDRHGVGVDTINGSYGRFGILRLHPFRADGTPHEGVGVHSGRDNSGGADHATMGCIRTTDAAMEAITQHIQSDPLDSITVQNNHEQSNRHPHRRGDHHHHHQRHAAPQHPLLI